MERMDGKEQGLNVLEALEHIDPATLTYNEWLGVGMGLKEAGYPASAWDEWSRRDPRRYHDGECARKWNSFRGADRPITAGTIVQMGLSRGWRPASAWLPVDRNTGHELGWEDLVGLDGRGPHSGENRSRASKESVRGIAEPDVWNPVEEVTRYIQALFEPGEYVGYVTKTYEKDGERKPSRGCFDRTAQKLLTELEHCGGDIGKVLGDYSPEAGAWIRFNPLDGKGIKDENVTNFRYTLVESDSLPIEKQNELLRELELPIAALVHSGGKSLHAIVRVEAGSREEYRRRVNYLYDVCSKNGLGIDGQNHNPSRLSRLPGVMRNGKKQFLLDTNIGKASWAEWRQWIETEGVDDELPNPERMSELWDHLPELALPLIEGVLRQGHKMLLAGPSKAGKSYALIELSCAIAEGQDWLGFHCTQGRVLYVNLELDRASCLHRFKDVYTALGYESKNLENIDVWNLRGKSVPMDKLAPKLIRRARRKNYIAIVIDPIYKVITGDENSADQMANFCNQFDKVCTELGCAVIYCHHHSKGLQGAKRSMDRASGSGVFARDPDALLDLIELPVGDELRTQIVNKAVGQVCANVLRQAGKWEEASRDDLCTANGAMEAARSLLPAETYKELAKAAVGAKRAAEARTAWRIEGTLREFPKFSPINLWFDYPIHRIDPTGALRDVNPEEAIGGWRQNFQSQKKKSPEEQKEDRKKSVAAAYEICRAGGEVTITSLAEYMGVTEKTARSHLKEHGGFWIDEGKVGKKQVEGKGNSR